MTDNTNETQDKRQRTKTVMLGPDITKEIRAQIEEQKLASIFSNDPNKSSSNQDIDVEIPSNFFYNENGADNANTQDFSLNGEDGYSIFGGENPIDEIQKDAFNDTEVLTNSIKNIEHQTQEVTRAKKETEEVASKIIKELILDSTNAPESTFKDTLIKEIENDENLFKKFEYNNNENKEEKICKNPKIISFGESEVTLESEDKNKNENDNEYGDESSLLEDFLSSSTTNNIKEDCNDNIKDDALAENLESDEQKCTNNNINTNINDNIIKDSPKIKEGRDQDDVNGIFWNNESQVVGFLVSFSRNPNGEFYELREGKLVITTRRNPNMSSLVIQDSLVSPMHAIFKIAQDKITLLDQFSENGTMIKHADSDEVLELSGESETIKDKDIITFGNITFKVCLI